MSGFYLDMKAHYYSQLNILQTQQESIMAFPSSSPYVIVGAGIHGLSTAYHLALELKASGR